MTRALELYEQAIQRRSVGDYAGAHALTREAEALADVDDDTDAEPAERVLGLLGLFLTAILLGVVIVALSAV